MTTSAHAAWLHLCPADADADSAAMAGDLPQAVIVRPDGSRQRISIGDKEASPGCRSVPLPLRAAQVAAIHPLPGKLAAPPGDTLLLQGADKEGRFAIASATVPSSVAATASSKPGTTPMPLHVNLLAGMRARPFGVEERISAELKDGRLVLDCRRGSKPAGVLLTAPWYLPQAELKLRLQGRGQGQFEWQLADAARVAGESALAIGKMAATTEQRSVDLPLPRKGYDRSQWRQFVLVCPQQQARLELDSVELAGTSITRTGRSSWVWQADAWQDNADALLAWAGVQQLSVLFVSVPTTAAGVVRDAGMLAAFVREASRRGIAVWAVAGDPHMVLPGERRAVVELMRAYAAYNASNAPDARLGGVQFDIEPYLLPGHELAAAGWERRYLELARALHDAAAGISLEFVVPFWWAEKPDLLRALAPLCSGLSVMDYRTAPEEIYRFAVPFLDWGVRYGKRVRIALEAGPVAAETQRRYQRVAPGAPADLWLLGVDDASVLLLLHKPQPNSDGPGFALVAEKIFDGTATTFHARVDDMLRLLPRLEREFGAWSSFGGMALHELRQHSK